MTGIGRTGRLITSAALILFLGFLAMSTAGQTDIRVLATGILRSASAGRFITNGPTTLVITLTRSPCAEHSGQFPGALATNSTGLQLFRLPTGHAAT